MRSGSTRLVTLCGPAGIGKTRVAIAAAEHIGAEWGGRVAFVDLAPLHDPTLLWPAIAAALGEPDAGAAPVREKLARTLGRERTLLVLDNFEHLLAAASGVADLIAAAPGVVVLATCRVRLDVPGEREVHLEPLAVPSAEVHAELAALAEVAAVQLFVERARAARPDFALTSDNALAIVAICRRLEGLPLAIELAAARIKSLSAEQIADRLHSQLRLFGGDTSASAARHHTLEATLDWSVRTLSAPDRVLLRRMSVCAGGATIDILTRLCPDPTATDIRRGASHEHACHTQIVIPSGASHPLPAAGQVERSEGSASSGVSPTDEAHVLDSIERLIDRSLVQVHEHAGHMRYRLHEMVRQYALQQLRAAGEDAHSRDRLAAYILELAEAGAHDLAGHHQVVVLEQLAAEFANVRVAMSWYLAHGDAVRATRLAVGVWKLSEVRGHAAEGERWLHAALAHLDDEHPALRGEAIHAAANLAFVRGEYERTAELHAENVALRQRVGDAHGAAISTFHLASVFRARGDAMRAAELCRESLTAFRVLDDRRWSARALNRLGMSLLDLRSFAAARAALDESLALFRGLGGLRGVAIALGNLGDLEYAEGAFEPAETRLRQSLDLFDRLGDAWGCSAALESLALVASARGSAIRSATLFGAADAQRNEAGAALAPTDLAVHEHAIATLRVRAGTAACEAAIARGRGMARPSAVAYARQSETNPALETRPAAPNIATLTGREREVVALVARGLSNQQIANELIVTKHTADKHVGNVLGKLGLGSRAQLAVWWVAQAGASSPRAQIG